MLEELTVYQSVRPSAGNWPVPKRSQLNTDVADTLARQDGSTNHGTVRL
jgi:hypothetical protein